MATSHAAWGDWCGGTGAGGGELRKQRTIFSYINPLIQWPHVIRI